MKISLQNLWAFVLIIIFVLANIAIAPSSSHAEDDEDEYEVRYEIEDEEFEASKKVPATTPTPTPDFTPPVITIVSPEDGSYVPYETSQIKIVARARDNNDSAPRLVGDGVQHLEMGINVFPLTATDKAGNVATASLVVTRDAADQEKPKESINQTTDETPQEQKDADHDGLTDFQEGIFMTDPTLLDTDGDGVSDGNEVSLLLNPLGSGKLFSDLYGSHYAAADILEFIKNGYVQGFGDGSFGTQKDLTRAEAAKLIVRSRNISLVGSNASTNRFSDVHTGDWFAPYIKSLVASGIARGYSDGTFGVHSAITRSEMVKMILMSYEIGAGFEDNSPQNTRFTDLDILSWAASYVEYAAENNILNGYMNGAFGPNDFITRGDAIKILSTAKKMIEDPQERKTIAFMNPQDRIARIALNKKNQERLFALQQVAVAPSTSSQKKSSSPVPARVNPETKTTTAPTPISSPVVPQDNSAQIAAQEADRKAAAQQEAAKIAAAEAAARAAAEAEAKTKAEAVARAAAEAAAAQASAAAAQAAKQQTQTQTRAS